MMQPLRKFTPLICLIFLIVLFIGWNNLDWKTTTVLPWAIWLFVLFICTLSWSNSFSPLIRRINAILCGITILLGILLVAGIVELQSIWALFVLAGFGSVHLYLYDLSLQTMAYKGNLRYILLIPAALTLYSVVGLYGWNGSLAAAWFGLLLMVLLAVIGLFKRN